MQDQYSFLELMAFRWIKQDLLRQKGPRSLVLQVLSLPNFGEYDDHTEVHFIRKEFSIPGCDKNLNGNVEHEAAKER